MIGAAASNFLRRAWGIALAAVFLASAHDARAADEVRTDYDNWQLYCATTKPGAAQECEIHQLLSNDQNKLAAGMYVGRRGSSTMLMVRVPLGVALNRNLMLQIDNGIGTDALTFLRCDTGGCLAQMTATEPFLDSLRKNSAVTLTMHADANTAIPVTFTLKGFADAERALAARSR